MILPPLVFPGLPHLFSLTLQLTYRGCPLWRYLVDEQTRNNQDKNCVRGCLGIPIVIPQELKGVPLQHKVVFQVKLMLKYSSFERNFNYCLPQLKNLTTVSVGEAQPALFCTMNWLTQSTTTSRWFFSFQSRFEC